MSTAVVDVAAIFQTFREKPAQPERLVSRFLAAATGAALSARVLVNDDSGEQPAAWEHVLRRGIDVYLRSDNIHEVRAYNGLAARANASLLVFLQGDECLPTAPSWLSEAALLFARFPRLAVLGGHAGFIDPGTEHTELGYAYGPYPRRPPIPFYVHGDVAAAATGISDDGKGTSAAVPFMHVPFVNIGPFFVRARAFAELGGFTSAYSAAGEPGGHFDGEYCMRAWIDGRHTCGLYYGRVGNGVGGHKTRIGSQAKMRRRNQRKAALDLRERWMQHNASIGAAISAANGQLLQFARGPGGGGHKLALQKARRESQASCGGK